MIELYHVSKTYPPNYRALTDINLEIAKGEIVFVCGASGAGKSTLLKLLFRQEDPTEGQILIDGRNVTRLGSRGVAQLRRKIGLVFQEFRLLPGLTVLDNVALAAQVVGKSKRESRTKAYQLLRELGLKERYEAKPFTLSGGEQQRVAIARALINEPMLVLADEPTGNIDDEMADEIMRLFLKIRDRGAAIVVATHDRAMVKRYGTRALYLQRGVLTDDQSVTTKREYSW
ncbi:MAG: cell division ATP-binding protein FtsE [Deltaproteobacteria bacterium]|jgi:cell division transport system ATP-binding protein|nr:MAG: cell division ATP-binding protein FtsE [Deltaproteobacteria bacterium]